MGILKISIAANCILLIHTAIGLSQAQNSAARPASPATSADGAGAADKLESERIYRQVIDVWAGGNQSTAESILDVLIQQQHPDPRIVFFRAACIRSRFNIGGALPGFRAVASASADSAEGRCAAIIVKLDTKNDVAAQFIALQRLADENVDNPLVLWMTAVQCRSLNENEIGVKYYEKLGKIIGPGPSLAHQTYANLLDQLKRFEEALIHRNLAVKLEPAGWSYQGLGNTLYSLGRFSEAHEACSKAIALSPGNSLYIWNYAECLSPSWLRQRPHKFHASAYSGSSPRAPRHFSIAYRTCAHYKGDEALIKYDKARKSDPSNRNGYDNVANLLLSLGRDDEAQKLSTPGCS